MIAVEVVVIWGVASASIACAAEPMGAIFRLSDTMDDATGLPACQAAALISDAAVQRPF